MKQTSKRQTGPERGPQSSNNTEVQQNKRRFPEGSSVGKTIRDNVFPIQTSVELKFESTPEEARKSPYREAVCDLCERTVSLALDVPLSGMQAGTRCSAEMALARQIAMYLSHTIFSLLLTEVGLHFKRDRSTVAHACAVVEDKRDDLTFDVLICQLESLLCDARDAMSICYVEGATNNASTIKEPISGLTVYQSKLLKGVS